MGAGLQPGGGTCEPAGAAPLGRADERDQRHADGRRHAGAAHHLHGDGAAAHGRRRRRVKGTLPKVELPKTEAGAVERRKAPLSVTIDPQGKIFLQNTEIGFDELMPKLTAIRDAGGGSKVWVRGDKGTPYGRRCESAGRTAGGHPRDHRHRPGGPTLRRGSNRRHDGQEHFHLGRAAYGDPALCARRLPGCQDGHAPLIAIPVDLATPSDITKIKAGMADAKDEAPLAGKPKEQKPEAVKEARSPNSSPPRSRRTSRSPRTSPRPRTSRSAEARPKSRTRRPRSRPSRRRPRPRRRSPRRKSPKSATSTPIGSPRCSTRFPTRRTSPSPCCRRTRRQRRCAGSRTALR